MNYLKTHNCIFSWCLSFLLDCLKIWLWLRLSIFIYFWKFDFDSCMPISISFIHFSWHIETLTYYLLTGSQCVCTLNHVNSVSSDLVTVSAGRKYLRSFFFTCLSRMVYNSCYLWSLYCAKAHRSLFVASCDLGAIDIVSLLPFKNQLSDLPCDQLSVLRAPCIDSNL